MKNEVDESVVVRYLFSFEFALFNFLLILKSHSRSQSLVHTHFRERQVLIFH